VYSTMRCHFLHATRPGWPLAAALALFCLLRAEALAQPLPAGPVSALDGKLAVGAEVAVTIGERDDEAFFNYTDYEHNTLRMFRVALSAAWRPVTRLAVVGEVRSEDLNAATARSSATPSPTST
jgi:hypothetical protein